MKSLSCPAILLALAVFCPSLDAQEYKASVNSKAPSKAPESHSHSVTRSVPRNPYTWNVDPALPINSIEVRVDEQKILVFQGNKLAAEAPICSGKVGHETPLGDFTIQAKDLNHRSSEYGCFLDSGSHKIVNYNASVGDKVPSGCYYEAADMPYFMRLTGGGVGMHAGFLPGYADSHGCIRLPKGFAEKLYEVVNVGTPVTVNDGGAGQTAHADAKKHGHSQQAEVVETDFGQ